MVSPVFGLGVRLVTCRFVSLIWVGKFRFFLFIVLGAHPFPFFFAFATGGALPEPYKIASSRQLVCLFLTKLSETDSMRVVWGFLLWDLCSQPSTLQLDWHWPVNTGTHRFATGAPFSSQMRAVSHWALVIDVKESGNAVANMLLPLTSSSIIGLVVGQW